MAKFSGFAVLLIAIAVLGGTVRGIQRTDALRFSATPKLGLAGELMALVTVSDPKRKQLARAVATIDRVQRLPHNARLAENLIALPPKSISGFAQRPELVQVRVAREHTVSMVYVGKTRQYAVVDGRFCEEGTRLPHGDMIRRIKPGAVLVYTDGVERWFHVGGAAVPEQAAAWPAISDSAGNT